LILSSCTLTYNGGFSSQAFSMKTVFTPKRYSLVALSCFAALLTLVTWFASGIDLRSPVPDFLGLTFTLVTDSAGSKGFAITLVALSLLVLRKHSGRYFVVGRFAVLALMLVLSFAGKTGLKQLTESPRPYTEWMASEHLVDTPQAFYNLDATQQVTLVKTQEETISPWRLQHWEGETDYSFPSGHTIFASLCVAFFGGIFLMQKRYVAFVTTLAWASLVAYSRLWIGMHRPEDLFGSLAFIAMITALLPNFLPIPTSVRKFLRIRESTV
jgi:phosphatidylglycerophosphatase B